MPPPRDIDPQGLYHVMSRGNFRQKIFLDEAHYAKYVRLLTRVARRRQWTVLDWCLIENHFHLVIRLENGGLSDGMRELNGCFARWSNARTGRTGTGHLFKNRFKARALSREGHFWEVLRYVPLNPVKAGLVSQPEGWRWSGYRATIGLEYPYTFHQPAELLRYFAVTPAAALRRYCRFVQEGAGRLEDVPWSDDVA
jgi:REP-associated tyrosine transposase